MVHSRIFYSRIFLSLAEFYAGDDLVTPNNVTPPQGSSGEELIFIDGKICLVARTELARLVVLSQPNGLLFPRG